MLLVICTGGAGGDVRSEVGVPNAKGQLPRWCPHMHSLTQLATLGNPQCRTVAPSVFTTGALTNHTPPLPFSVGKPRQPCLLSQSLKAGTQQRAIYLQFDRFRVAQPSLSRSGMITESSGSRLHRSRPRPCTCIV